MSGRVLIAPSILSADFGELAGAVRLIESVRADYVHIDVMDGSFVPNITFGPKAVADLRPVTALPFDVHLMIARPESFIDAFAAAGADILTIHLEATTHVHRVLAAIRALGKRPGISIVPSTPAEALEEILWMVDVVLVMTVDPGFGGQEMIERCLRKVERLRKLKERERHGYLIEVDGGINRGTIRSALDAGAELIVAGSAVFDSQDPQAEVAFLRGGW